MCVLIRLDNAQMDDDTMNIYYVKLGRLDSNLEATLYPSNKTLYDQRGRVLIIPLRN